MKIKQFNFTSVEEIQTWLDLNPDIDVKEILYVAGADLLMIFYKEPLT